MPFLMYIFPISAVHVRRIIYKIGLTSFVILWRVLYLQLDSLFDILCNPSNQLIMQIFHSFFANLSCPLCPSDVFTLSVISPNSCKLIYVRNVLNTYTVITKHPYRVKQNCLLQQSTIPNLGLSPALFIISLVHF